MILIKNNVKKYIIQCCLDRKMVVHRYQITSIKYQRKDGCITYQLHRNHVLMSFEIRITGGFHKCYVYYAIRSTHCVLLQAVQDVQRKNQVHRVKNLRNQSTDSTEKRQPSFVLKESYFMHAQLERIDSIFLHFSFCQALNFLITVWQPQQCCT